MDENADATTINAQLVDVHAEGFSSFGVTTGHNYIDELIGSLYRFLRGRHTFWYLNNACDLSWGVAKVHMTTWSQTELPVVRLLNTRLHSPRRADASRAIIRIRGDLSCIRVPRCTMDSVQDVQGVG
jgi:hypothetical protein